MLSQKPYDLPNGLQLYLPIADYHSARLGRIEGAGIVPTVGVPADQALAKALEGQGTEVTALVRTQASEAALREKGVTAPAILGDVVDVQTLRGMTGLEVLSKRVKVEAGKIVEYRVDMKINFVLE